LLVKGPGPSEKGADKLRCGAGKKDVATADANDTVKRSCKRVRGI